MSNSTLSARVREGAGKGVARKLRAVGQVPAVVYGKDMDTVHLSIDAHEATHLFSSIAVGSTIVDLEIEGEKRPLQTLVREVQTHPYRPVIWHIDFLRIQKGVAVEVEVPLHIEGTPEGVRIQGGNLELVMHMIPVKCVPAKIPESISVDVTALMIGDSLHVSDLETDEDVQILLDDDQTLVNVAAPRAEEEVVEDEEEGVAELEGAADDAPAAEAAEEATEDGA